MSLKTVVAAGVVSLALASGAGARTQIRVVGSSTVYPFTTAVAEQFKRTNPQFDAPVVESTGTGGGMKLFCSGVGERFPDIEDASRRIKPSELKQCAAAGVTSITEIQIGVDGLTLARSKRSPAIALTPRDVYMALAANPFGGPANRARTWKDVNPKLPAEKIEVIGPPPTSGTRDSFNELLLAAGCKSNPAMVALENSNPDKFKLVCTKMREDGAYIEGGENDNLIVQKIEANPTMIGAFGYSFLEENGDKLTGTAISGYMPTYDNIATFKYPVSRPLYLYVKNQHVRAVRGIREFLAEYTKESTWGKRGYLAKKGLVAAPDAVRAQAAKNAAGLLPLNFASVK